MFRHAVNKFKKKPYLENEVNEVIEDSVNEASGIEPEPAKPTISPEEIIAELENNNKELIKKRKEWFDPNHFSDEQLAALLDVTVKQGLLSIVNMFLNHSLSKQVRDRLKQQLAKFDFKPYEINGVYKGKYNILQLCIKKGCTKLFKWLVTEKKHSIARSENNDIDLFRLAATHGRLNIMRQLSKWRPKDMTLSRYVRQYTNWDAGVLLVETAKSGRIKCAQWLITAAGYFNKPAGKWVRSASTKGYDWINKLIYKMYSIALKHEQKDFINYLLEHTDINTNGASILHLFIQYGDLERVKQLIDQGCAIYSRNNVGDEPIHLAARLGRLEELKYIISQRSELTYGKPLRDRENSYDETILEIAASVGHQDIVQWVLQQKKMPVPELPESPAERASILDKKGDELVDKSKRLACGYYLQAVRIQSEITENNKTASNLHNLAVYQNDVGIAAPTKKGKLDWYQAAINTIHDIPVQERKSKNWRLLGIIHANRSYNLGQAEGAACFKSAHGAASQIPKNERTEDDLATLEKYARRAGILEKTKAVSKDKPNLSQEVDELKNQVAQLIVENKKLSAEVRSHFASGLTTFRCDPGKKKDPVIQVVDAPAAPVFKLA